MNGIRHMVGVIEVKIAFSGCRDYTPTDDEIGNAVCAMEEVFDPCLDEYGRNNFDYLVGDCPTGVDPKFFIWTRQSATGS